MLMFKISKFKKNLTVKKYIYSPWLKPLAIYRHFYRLNLSPHSTTLPLVLASHKTFLIKVKHSLSKPYAKKRICYLAPPTGLKTLIPVGFYYSLSSRVCPAAILCAIKAISFSMRLILSASKAWAVVPLAANCCLAS
jgi:hypothetical protein